ncbi:hypothetical protein V2J09_021677 [Rumex salicifolius]
MWRHAAKIIANLIVMGSGIMIRAFAQAYRQALANASKNGVAQEAMQNTIRRASKAMTEQEARQILGITENSSWEEILKKYDVLFENNAKQGSFYLQSKVHRAKECLEAAKVRELLLKERSSNMNDEIVSDSEWINELECDPYYGIPSELPQEVVETFTDYNSDSSASPMRVYVWEVRKEGQIIYHPFYIIAQGLCNNNNFDPSSEPTTSTFSSTT